MTKSHAGGFASGGAVGSAQQKAPGGRVVLEAAPYGGSPPQGGCRAPKRAHHRRETPSTHHSTPSRNHTKTIPPKQGGARGWTGGEGGSSPPSPFERKPGQRQRPDGTPRGGGGVPYIGQSCGKPHTTGARKAAHRRGAASARGKERKKPTEELESAAAELESAVDKLRQAVTPEGLQAAYWAAAGVMDAVAVMLEAAAPEG